MKYRFVLMGVNIGAMEAELSVTSLFNGVKWRGSMAGVIFKRSYMITVLF